MDWVWTWGGKCFGYLDEDDLWTYDGKHVGRRDGDDIYGADGHYLGELKNEDRLITNRSKRSRRQSPFRQKAKRGGQAKYANYPGYAMLGGYEDFPAPSEF